MEFNVGLTYLLEAIVAVQGFILGSFLIYLNIKKYRSTLFIGIFLLISSLQIIPDTVLGLNLIEKYPDLLYRLPFNFFWLFTPVFYLYTQQVSIFNNKKKQYWLLIPGIISFLSQCVLYFFPFEVKEAVNNSLWFSLILRGAGACFALIVGIWNFQLLRKHKIEVNNHFSYAENKELQWAEAFLIFFGTGCLLTLFQYYFLPKNLFSRIFTLCFEHLVIYWLCYRGIVQQNVYRILDSQKNSGIPKYKQTDVLIAIRNNLKEVDENQEILMQEIEQLMAETESFIQSELTIIDLAKQLKSHPKRISAAINSVNGQNFNAYINELRIKKAKGLLKNNELKNLSVEGIGNEVGFHSKSAFYSAFKKVTGTTPKKYISLFATAEV